MFAREHRLAACVKPQRLVAFAPRGVQVHPQPIGRLARGVDLSIRRTRSSPSSGGAARAEACIASSAVADTPPRSGRKGTAADIRSLADRGDSPRIPWRGCDGELQTGWRPTAEGSSPSGVRACRDGRSGLLLRLGGRLHAGKQVRLRTARSKGILRSPLGIVLAVTRRVLLRQGFLGFSAAHRDVLFARCFIIPHGA
uniref:Uncharacterized protein n=1 Tax=Cereibacter sphaeroides (strain ATCC 17025 / ATH 2.4.3) TaxID=349102 RepID=A4WYA1_CERS5